MSDRYPKSIDELTIENNQLREKVAGLEQFARSLEDTIKSKEAEVQVLRRRKPPTVLDKDAKDAFQRPFMG